MCYYHAYTHRCGHTEMVFEQYCSQGQMHQQKCPRSNPGRILTTVKIEFACANCGGPGKVWFVLLHWSHR
ncbi:hypothetical protein M011DRAFT_407318 [Sporormia fimetaria CBS 119925]|uniref:Uncharacterized protein n=1 Tax=Sporormia fimetaria CBS 119925 TaxID=1340428 RepID=A0A6A6V6M7_9PLEO|nr:hypothetical protein M011DRAFT_407318 [Sporormia fimetaria CBS 119925]